jgi:serine phosphatase RsbU (regulator of sigma subunit)
VEVVSLCEGRVAGINRPCEGEKVSGDSIFSFALAKGIVVGIADGLGHGQHAHEISIKIKECIEYRQHSDISTLLYDAHNAISPCDGAAVGLAYINFEGSRCSFTAVGNIGACIIGSQDKSFIFKDGMVGSRMRTPLVQSETLIAGDKIILFSDGIQERFYNQCNRLLLKKKPLSVVDTLIENYGKNYDDASCWVVGI